MWRILLVTLAVCGSAQEPQKVELPPARMRVAAGAPILGPAAAPVTLVEFTDFQCPYCRQFHTTTFPLLKKKYIDTGKVRFTQHDLPLQFHGNAVQAAEAVRCAGDQNRYWQMRDVVAANPAKLNRAGLEGLARSRKYEQAVKTEAEKALRSRIRGTPSFILGRTTPEGVDGLLIPGAISLEDFSRLIDRFLAMK